MKEKPRGRVWLVLVAKSVGTETNRGTVRKLASAGELDVVVAVVWHRRMGNENLI